MLNILLIGQDVIDWQVVDAHITCKTTPEEGWRALVRGEYDAGFVDGLPALEFLHGHGVTTPLVLVTDDYAETVQALALGYEWHIVRAPGWEAMVPVVGRRVQQHALRAATPQQAEDRLIEITANLSEALIESASLDDIAYLVLQHAKRYTDSAFGYVGHIDAHTGYLVTGTMTRDIWELCQVEDKSIMFEKFGGMWGWVLEHGEAILTNDPANDPRSTGTPEGHLPIQRFLSVPAMIGDEVVGQIALANANRDYNTRDLAAIEQLAHLYALSIQRTRAEYALRESKAQLQALFDSSPQAVILLDTNYRIVAFNQLALESNRRRGNHDYEVGASIRDYASAANMAELTTNYECCLRGETVRYERRLALMNGSEVDLDVMFVPVYDAAGSLMGVALITLNITERKRADESLQENRERLELALWGGDLGMWDWDLQSGNLIHNEYLAHSLGYEPNEMPTNLTMWLGLIHPDDLVAVRDLFSATYLEPELRELEHRFRARSGEWRWVLTRGKVVEREADGTPIRIVGILQDITERKEAEESYRVLVAHSLQGLAIYLDRQLVAVNPAMADMTGYTMDELTSGPGVFRLLIPPEAYEDEFQRLEAIWYGTPRPHNYETQLVCKDGQRRDVEVRAVPVEYRGRRAIQFSYLDITAHKAAQREVEQSERRYRAIVEDQTDMICRYKPDGTLTFVNQALVRYFEGAPEYGIGRNPFVRLSSEEQETIWANIGTLTRETPIRNIEYRERLPDGSYRWQRWTNRAIFDDNGRIVEYQAVGRDITAQVLAECEREQVMDDLNSFTQIVAHDLKQPLQLLITYVGLLDEEDLPTDADMLAHQIGQTAHRMTRIVTELLRLAELRDMEEIELERLDMCAIVRRTLDWYQFMIDERCASVQAPDEWPLAMGYAPWIEEVWANYISNALKYGGEPPRLRLGYHRQADDRIKFWLRDNGSGLDTKQRSAVFDRFTRLERTRAEGQGLGLPIVKRIVEKLGGEVGCDSGEGMGCVFWFTLPST